MRTCAPTCGHAHPHAHMRAHMPTCAPTCAHARPHAPVLTCAHVLARAAGAVATGGRLLITEHASRPPGSNAPEDTVYPSAEETLASLDLDPRQWRGLCVCAIAGMGTRDEVQGETVKDNVIFLERIG